MRKLLISLVCTMLSVVPANAATFSGTITSGEIPADVFLGSEPIDATGLPMTLVGTGMTYPSYFENGTWQFTIGNEFGAVDFNYFSTPPGHIYYGAGGAIVGFSEAFVYNGDNSAIEGSIDSPDSTDGWTITRTARGFSGVMAPGGTPFNGQTGINNGEASFEFTITSFSDDIVPITSFAPTPEPSSWMIVLCGFGLTGLAFRRCRQPLSPLANS
jgi:hypothetical protein